MPLFPALFVLPPIAEFMTYLVPVSVVPLSRTPHDLARFTLTTLTTGVVPWLPGHRMYFLLSNAAVVTLTTVCAGKRQTGGSRPYI